MAGRADLSKFRAKNAQLRKAAELGAKRGVVAGADAFVDALETIAPVDTGRYKAAWQMAMLQAGRGLGGKPRMVEPLTEGGHRYLDIVSRLTQQLAQYDHGLKFRKDRLHRWFDSLNRKYTPWARRELAKIRTMEKRRQRAFEELEKAIKYTDLRMPILLFGAGHGRRVATIRWKVYGGVGRCWSYGKSAFIRLANKEPHARLVEANSQVQRRAESIAGGAGDPRGPTLKEFKAIVKERMRAARVAG